MFEYSTFTSYPVRIKYYDEDKQEAILVRGICCHADPQKVKKPVKTIGVKVYRELYEFDERFPEGLQDGQVKIFPQDWVISADCYDHTWKSKKTRDKHKEILRLARLEDKREIEKERVSDIKKKKKPARVKDPIDPENKEETVAFMKEIDAIDFDL